MKHTGKLMAGVTASILLTGTPPTGVAAPASPQKAEQQDETWKTDPEVSKAAVVVFNMTKAAKEETAMTLEEVMREVPKFTPAMVERALKKLVFDGRLDRLGTGSASNPYRYFCRQNCGGGG